MKLTLLIPSLVVASSLAHAQLDCAVLKLQVAGDSDGVCLGSAVALDGDTAAVASPAFVTIYRLVDDVWLEEDSLAIGAFALDLCGDTLVAGNHFIDGAAVVSGVAWVYTRSGTTWSQDAKLVASDGEPGDRFGYAVAATPNEVVVGASFDQTVHGAQGGSAYVFRPTGAGWSEVQHLVPSDGDLDARYGQAIELDDDRLVIGSPNWQSGPGQPFTGKVYVYERSGTAWTVADELLPSSGYVDEDFGHSLSLDGDRLAVGTYAFFSGEDPLAYVFAFDGVDWTEEVMLSFMTLGNYYEAGHVALQGDLLAVGERTIKLFRRTASWDPIGTVSVTADSNPFTGGVELDDSRLLTGAPDVDFPPHDATGIVQIRQLGFGVSSYCSAKLNGLGCLPTMAWTGSPSASDPLPFTIEASDVLSGKNGILFYGLLGRAALPFAGGTLCAQPPLIRSAVQNSAGNAPPTDCSGSFSLDFNALIQSGQMPALSAGRVVHAQYWSRDPLHPDGTGLSLTDALELTICP